MAKAARSHTRAQNATVSAPEQHRCIAEQTEAFLAAGGRIQRIDRGVSGYPKLAGPQSAAASKTDN